MEERWHSDSGMNVIYALKSDRSKVVFDVDIIDGHAIAERENAPAQGWTPIAVVHSAGLRWREPDAMGCPDANGQLHDAATVMRGEAREGITIVTLGPERHPAGTETKLGTRIANTMDDAAKRNDSSYLARLQSALDPADPGSYTSLREVPAGHIERALITKLRTAYVDETCANETTDGPIERECQALVSYAEKLLDGLLETS